MNKLTVKMEGGPVTKFRWGGKCGKETIGGLIIEVGDYGPMVMTRKDCVKLGKLMRENIGMLEFGKEVVAGQPT